MNTQIQPPRGRIDHSPQVERLHSKYALAGAVAASVSIAETRGLQCSARQRADALATPVVALGMAEVFWCP